MNIIENETKNELHGFNLIFMIIKSLHFYNYNSLWSMPNVLSLQFFIVQVKIYICYHFYLQGDVPLDVPCLRNDYPVVLLDQNRIKE